MITKNNKARSARAKSGLSTELIKKYAKGNVGLQVGRFITLEEKEIRRRRVISRVTS